MSPDLQTLFATVAGQLVGAFGCAATYTNGDGDDAAVTVALTRAQAEVGDFASVSETQWTAELATAAVPHPAPGDSMTFAAGTLDALIADPDRAGAPVTFTVRGITAGDGFTWTLAVTLALPAPDPDAAPAPDPEA